MAAQEHTAALLGVSEAAAMAYARDHRLAARVVTRDGVHLPVKADLLVGRINLEVADGQVVGLFVEQNTEPNVDWLQQEGYSG
jgi:hypothetical protein